MIDYEKTITNIRKERNKKTASDSLHWLNLAGLFWLEEGENTFGSDNGNKIVLPSFPYAHCGSLFYKDEIVTLHPANDVKITINGKAPDARPIVTDIHNEPDLIDIGSFTIKIIIRGGKPLARIWDRESSEIKKFTGFHYYPVKPEYKVVAKYVRYDPPRPIKVLELIGTEVDSMWLGQAQFTLHGVDCTLEAEQNGGKLLFNFTDETNKTTTYGGGRKFSIPNPENDEIILDFNLTENWPCSYTPYAACPIPPKENRLPIKIEAGELKYHE
jgi:uncharacterized protein (DUF1684 family)